MGTVMGCSRAPDIVTTLVFDGQSRTIITNKVSCTNQADGRLLILVDGGRTQSVRIVVDRGVDWSSNGPAALPGLGGIRRRSRGGRGDQSRRHLQLQRTHAPKAGELLWPEFEIETTCPSYLDEGPTPLPGSYMS
jgi:hypothetical protein